MSIELAIAFGLVAFILAATLMYAIVSRPRGFNLARWWRAPVSREDRRSGAISGAIACFWLGLIVFAFFGPSGASLPGLLSWPLVAAPIGAIVGAGFPKPVQVASYPLVATTLLFANGMWLG